MDHRDIPRRVAVLSRSFATASDAPFRRLEEAGFSYTVRHNTDPENTRLVAELIADADAVIPGSDVIDRTVLDRCPNLKVISKHGVGLDAIDLELCRERGIRVCCTPNANNEAVADLTVLLMLALQRRLRSNLLSEATPSWGYRTLSRDLFGAAVGLVGCGRIGMAVARRLAGFSARILVYDPFLDPAALTTPNTRLVSLEELLAQSDIVSLHLPLTEATANLIGAEAIARMRDGALVINTSRGGTLDYRALYGALVSGKLGGAGLDVYPVEPPVNEPLLTLPNVLATPHIATYTKEANLRMGLAAAENVIRFFAGEG